MTKRPGTPTQPTVDPRPLRGFSDMSPREARALERAITGLDAIADLHALSPIQTPSIVPVAQLLDTGPSPRGVQSSLLPNAARPFKFTDRGGRVIGLRHDLTVPLSRFLAFREDRIRFPVRVRQRGVVWRAESSGRGVPREFWQYDADVVGGEHSVADTELLLFARRALEFLAQASHSNDPLEFEIALSDTRILEGYVCARGVSTRTLTRILHDTPVTGIGPARDARAAILRHRLERAGTPNKITSEISDFAQDYSSTNAEVFEKVSSVVLGSDSPAAAAASVGLKSVQKLIDTLDRVTRSDDHRSVRLRFVPFLALGFDYYNSTLFQFRDTGTRLGSPSSSDSSPPDECVVGGGGRYDGIQERFGGTPRASVGLSLNLTRLVRSMLQDLDPEPPRSVFLVLPSRDEHILMALGFVEDLRRMGIPACVHTHSASHPEQMKFADATRARFVVTIDTAERWHARDTLKADDSGVWVGSRVEIDRWIRDRIGN